ncbi:hypothetical protein Ciccas_010645 [Cichlidogyrus casuarinus]|uniref:C-type lectin domain-containing protein n=1 Tax=Cichlidogyrus casuarinus TaxID=1844966 RepID=A0ABD2PUP8_9PLAT
MQMKQVTGNGAWHFCAGLWNVVILFSILANVMVQSQESFKITGKSKIAILSSEPLTWTKARDFCQAMGRSLYAPQSKDRLLFAPKNIWVDVRRSCSNLGKWFDSTGREVTKIIERWWTKSQPDDVDEEENCVNIEENTRKLNDAHCRLLMYAACV